jgi:hypothetical protein
MSGDAWEYVQGAELPDAALTWREWDGDLIPFGSVPHTFELKIAAELGVAALVTKTSGLTGADTDPNLLVQWTGGIELSTLASGIYVVQIRARRTSDSKDRFFKFLPLTIKPAIS